MGLPALDIELRDGQNRKNAACANRPATVTKMPCLCNGAVAIADYASDSGVWMDRAGPSARNRAFGPDLNFNRKERITCENFPC